MGKRATKEMPVPPSPTAAGTLWRIWQGDVLDRLRKMPADHFHCVVTSPPYWALRDYGVPGQLGLEPTPEAHVAAMVEVFREVRRVLRPDGVLWLNYGDCYAGAGCGGDTGKTTLEGSIESQEASKAARRHTGLAAARVDRDGPNGSNKAGPPGQAYPDGGLRRRPAGLKPKDLVGMPWRVAFALQADGWFLRSDCIWAKPNPMPESCTDRPTKSHEYVFLLTKRARYFYAAAGAEDPSEVKARILEGLRKRTSSWRAGCKCDAPGNVPCRILDPFAGSGTVLKVALELGHDATGIELNPEYIEIARRRLSRGVQAPLIAGGGL